MELNFKGLENLRSKTPADRAQRVKKDNGVICLVYYWSYDH